VGGFAGQAAIAEVELHPDADSVLEALAKTIFDQAENRLYAQKAILSLIAKRG
jgi:ornithine carbamoyltransferase